MRSSSTSAASLALLGVLLLAGCGAEPAPPPAAPTPEPAAVRSFDLLPEAPRELELAGGGADVFRFPAAAGDVLAIEVLQRGIDVVVTLRAPDGNDLVAVDGLFGAAGRERILWLAESSGVYGVEVAALAANAVQGQYRIALTPPRPATAEDRRRVAAARLFAEAEALRVERDEDVARRALAKYQEALTRWDDLGDASWGAEVLHSLGYLHRARLYDYDKALLFYQRAFAAAGDDLAFQATALQSLGQVYYRLEEIEPALDYGHRALRIWTQLGERRGEAQTANNLALIYDLLGEMHRALPLYDRAVGLSRAGADRRGESTALHNRGRCYFILGRHQEALDDFHSALSIRRQQGWEPQIASTLNFIGQLYTEVGDFDRALDSLQQALALVTGDDSGRAVTLTGIGSVYSARGERKSAYANFDEALAIFRRIDDRRSAAAVLRRLALLDEAGGDPATAGGRYREVLALSRDIGERYIEAEALLGLARAERQLGDLAVAKQHAEAALADIDELRAKPASLDLRSSYFATKQNYYDFYVDLLMELHRRDPDAGHHAAALAASERARARSLLDTLIEGGADLGRGAAPALSTREAKLEREIRFKESQRTRLLTDATTTQPRLAAAERELLRLLREYKDVRSQIRQSDPHYAALTQPRPLDAAEIQERVLDGETLLLEYDLGEERSFLWAVTRERVESYELPPRAEIERTARLVYDLLTMGNQRRLAGRTEAALAHLAETVLGPVADHLESRRLLIVSEGVLQYVPFAALPDPATAGKTPLGAGHEIVSVSSASTLDVLRRQLAGRAAAPGAVAVLADPVFRDRPPLPSSRREAEAILALAPPERSLRALGHDASRETVLGDRLKEYGVVHFATHGRIDATFPELSGLALSDVDREGRPRDGFLRVHEIYNLDLTADLVVLSACQTALGEEVRGEGLVGLTQGFLYAGAARILVSLWSVDDEATAELMAHFYRHLLQDGASPAAALRAAQEEIRNESRWRAPYYWAGFVLQGEWR